jgi:two-component system, OmpR family, sensor kinase
MLSYGALVLAAIGVFGTLVLVLTMNALMASAQSAVRAEARVAALALESELQSSPPYWPDALVLPNVDAYREPGVSIEVLDAGGSIRYRSAGGTSILVPPAVLRSALSSQTVWFTPPAGEQATVAAVPIRAPGAGATGANRPGPVVGVLVVGKSLGDVNATGSLLQSLLISVGVATLAITLLGAWVVGSRVLRPLTEIGKTARAIAQATTHTISPAALSCRASAPGSHDELGEVVELFNDMLAALEKATQTQRRFVADASHELRAPLTTMQGNLAFLERHLEDLPPGERRTMLADAHAETLRLSQLVDQMLLLARADAGADAEPAGGPEGEASCRQVTELDRVVLQLVRQLRGRLRAEGSPVRIDLGRIEPARVHGDEETLRRMAVILLDNAIKYCAPHRDSEAGLVTISLERADDEAVLRVHDSGIGISAEDLPHIFDRFFRADQARGRQGTGLGLSIAQTLVEQLGGHLDAESTPGQGSTFSLAVPIAAGQ